MPDKYDVMRDKTAVRESLYGDPSKLGARVDLHARFSANPISISTWELDLIDLSCVRRALDAGCGTGVFLLPLARRLAPQGGSVIGLDLSEGTLSQARSRAEAEHLPVDLILGDIEALPFADASFDLALANYMLYHVPNLDQAIGELRRVLRPCGSLLAATNGEGYMREMWQLVRQSVARLGVPVSVSTARQNARPASSFRLEDGADALRRHFTDVRLERYPGELRITEAEPLVAYLASLWVLDEIVARIAPSPADQPSLRERLLGAFRALVEERIAAEGAVTIRQDTGVFIAR